MRGEPEHGVRPLVQFHHADPLSWSSHGVLVRAAGESRVTATNSLPSVAARASGGETWRMTPRRAPRRRPDAARASMR